MNFELFRNEIVKRITVRHEGDEVLIKPITKNNGVVLWGLSISDGSSKIVPTIYLDGFYKDDLTYDDIDKISKEIENECYLHRITESPDMSFFSNYEEIMDHLFVKAISRKMNSEYTNDLVCREYLDLYLVCYLSLDNTDGFKDGVIYIKKEHIKPWGVSEEEVLDQAMNNMYKHDFTITPLSVILADMFSCGKGTDRENSYDEIEKTMRAVEDRMPMYVLSSLSQTFAGAALANMGFLKSFSEKLNQNLIIIPSSIYELIVIPDDGEHDVWELDEMVKEVNRTAVNKEDVLSDHVYYFDRKLPNELIY